MEAVILAAGYATRLKPLTDKKAKPLLRVGPKPIIDHILDRMDSLEDLRRIHVVSNDKFFEDFVAWAGERPDVGRIIVYNDGTFENSDRLGAIGDAEYVIRAAEIHDDLLVVAGDNLFEFELGDMQRFFRQHGTTAAVYHFPDRELIKQYSTVVLDEDKRVVEFVEKPEHPKTDLIGICCYMFRHEAVPLVGEYLKGENNPDAPGYFLQWLHTVAPVYGFEFDGLWYDIGDLASLEDADRQLRERAGMPAVEGYMTFDDNIR